MNTHRQPLPHTTPPGPTGCQGGNSPYTLHPGQRGKSSWMKSPGGWEMMPLREKWHFPRACKGGRCFPEEKTHAESWKGKVARSGTRESVTGTLCRAASRGWGLGPDWRLVLKRQPERDARRWGRGQGERGRPAGPGSQGGCEVELTISTVGYCNRLSIPANLCDHFRLFKLSTSPKGRKSL